MNSPSVTRELVAAEAHYHHSCYHSYTRQKEGTNKECFDEYSSIESEAYEMLFEYITIDLAKNPRLTLSCKTRLPNVKDEHQIIKAALCIRQETNNLEMKSPWPPSDLHENAIFIRRSYIRTILQNAWKNLLWILARKEESEAKCKFCLDL